MRLKWRARIKSTSGNAVYFKSGGYVEGLRISGAPHAGVKFEDETSGVVRDCWISHCRDGVAAHKNYDTIIEKNLIEFNGSHVHYDHGIYADGDGIVIRQNIIRHNAGWGIHLYPNANNCRIEGNVIHGQSSGRGVIICGGDGNAVTRNTIDDKFALETRESKLNLFDGNLYIGEWGVQEDGNIEAADEDFVDRLRGVYWLAKELGYGAYPFRSHMLSDGFRDSWTAGWPYYLRTFPMPDPWSTGAAGTVVLGGK
jgi:parallel beta-helix repeat protein